MYKLPSSSNFGSRWVCGLLAASFLGLLPARFAGAQTFINDQNLYLNVPNGPLVTNIDATAFVNKNIYSVTYDTINNNQVQIVEPWWGTLFYTNTGEMMVNAPLASITNGFLTLSSFLTAGVGFEFDLQQGNSNVMAGTFYNPGIIHCNSTLDGNNTSGILFSFSGGAFLPLITIGDCFVSATNIIDPGDIVGCEGGQLNLNGQNVDLTRSVLTLEQGVVNTNNVNVSVNSEGEGINTNGYLPGFSLTPTNAQASFPDFLNLSFSTPYFQQVQTGPTNFLVRAVFIVNANTNVSDTVYVAPSTFDNEGALIQWSGTFLDPATGLTDTNYLYLFHYYPGSFGLTNLFPILSAGTPAIPGFISAFNYLWSQPTPYPGLPAPNTPAFPNNFPDFIITNTYEFFNGNLLGTTVSTNESGLNPGGALTNLPNRLIINASHELKMNLAQISGPNYVSINATNQFDGSPGALIYTPYADLNLAVTNGYPQLTVSNLLASGIPEWGGTLNEWSSRWTNTDGFGNDYDFRVMLVYANLTPSITPEVQNLTLTATNLLISDTLSVIGSLSANAQKLTLTTNALGSGATSLDGELDLQQLEAASWSWNGSFPYLLFLTNNGAIRMPNTANFISSAAVSNGVSTISAIPATNILLEAGGANVASGSSVDIGGGTPYSFAASISKSSPAYSVLIGTKFDGSMSNLIAAINGAKGAGTLYGTNGYFSPNASVTAGPLLANLLPAGITNHGFVVTATIPGTNPGNIITTTTTATNLLWTNSASGVTLAGGADPIPGYTNTAYAPTNYLSIVNNGLMSDQGSTIWVSNFVNSGVFTNGTGSFLLTSWNATLTNGSIFAGGDISLAANTLVASNVTIQAGRSLSLLVTNSFTDLSVSNGSLWTVGASNVTGFNSLGLNLPFLPSSVNNLPTTNNLLGETVFVQSPPPNKALSNYWAGLDYGVTTNGYNTNNMAIGQLILSSLAANSTLCFSGPPGSTNNNAIYVDRLVLEDYAGLAYPNWQGVGGPPTMVFNTNASAGTLTIYYADALSSETVNGGPLQDVSYILNGLNGGHFVWVPQYAGYFSSTTNKLNVGLVENSQPAVVASRINFKLAAVNLPQKSLKMTWESFPGATNSVYYSTNLAAANWVTLTNFVSPTNLPPVGVWPINDVLLEPYNLSVPDVYYRVTVTPNSSGP